MQKPGRVGDPALSFPMLVTFGALATALLLFFTHTVTAIHEQRQLEQVEQRMLEERAESLRRLIALRRGQDSPATDVQALLVTIDRLGLTPAELLALHPEAGKSGDDTVDRQHVRHVRGN